MSKHDRFTLPLPPGVRFSDFEWTLVPKPPTKSTNPLGSRKERKIRHLAKMNDQAKDKLARLDREYEQAYIRYLERKIAAYADIIARDKLAAEREA